MHWENYFSLVDESAAWLRGKVTIQPEIVLVLSGGLDCFVEGIESPKVFETHDVPHFPASKVEGHAGKLIFGTFKGKHLALMQGRQHYYEGHAPQKIVFPSFVLHALGATTLITTNAVGGIRHDLNAGDIMAVTDHINMMANNPLIGITVQKETNQFPNMNGAYDPELRQLAKSVAKEQGIDLKEGVYAATSGPNYETPAEVKMLRALGADAVGMSTVFEVIAARYLGLRVLTFNAIANPAADRHKGELNHHEVLAAMKALSPKLVSLLQGIVEGLS